MKKNTQSAIQTVPMPYYFPHILRTIAASVSRGILLVIWLTLYSIILMNLFSDILVDKTNEQILQNAILKNPFTSTPHEKIGHYYLSYNKDMASKEYSIAQTYFQTDAPASSSRKILGMELSPKATWENLNKADQNLNKQASFYEQILHTDPNYHYAAVQLINIYLALGKKDQGKILLSQLEKTAPYNGSILELKKEYE